jgi:GPR1/FUN34/yaaH family
MPLARADHATMPPWRQPSASSSSPPTLKARDNLQSDGLSASSHTFQWISGAIALPFPAAEKWVIPTATMTVRLGMAQFATSLAEGTEMRLGRRDTTGPAPAAPSPDGKDMRGGRASGRRRYRTSDGQTIIGYTSSILGALSLGGVLLGYLRGSEIVPMFLVAAFGQIAATGWCAIDRKFQVATIFATLAGFNLSYALLQLGVTNDWYSIPIQDMTNVLNFYSIIWITIFTLLSLVALNASVGAFFIFIAMDAALALMVSANALGSLLLLRWSATPIGLVIVISAGFIAHVMWGWHRRKLADAARSLAAASGGEAASPASTPTLLRESVAPRI